MQGRHILLLLLIAAAILSAGCMTQEEREDAPVASPTPTPMPVVTVVTEEKAVGGGLPAPTPPVPTRGERKGSGPHKVGFVDPQTYRIATPTPTIPISRPPDDVRVSGKMVEYATVTLDYPPRILATEVYHIPFPYWDLNVSVTPMNDFPWIVIEVRDADDPNRIVKEVQYSRSDILQPGDKTKGKEEGFTIREGYGDYYVIIRSESLKSLTITIKIPEKYLV
jgi:hypothetical protein